MLWTAPTPAGEAALDPFHPLAPVKRLGAKPLEEFEGSDDFLRLLQAEKEGLVSASVGWLVGCLWLPRRGRSGCVCVGVLR